MRNVNYIGFIRLILMLISFSTILLLTNCGDREVEVSEDSIDISEKIPIHSKELSNASLKDLFLNDNLRNNSKSKSTNGYLKINWVLQNIDRIEDIILNREIDTQDLETGVQLTHDIINSLPNISTKKCSTQSRSSSFDPKGICNKYATLFSKISEIRYYQGDLLPHQDDFITKTYYFDLGKESGSKGLRFNAFSVNALFWKATNLGSWVGAIHQQYKFNIFKLIRNNKTLTKTPSEVEAMLHQALKINPKFKDGVIHLALGRLYHKVPEKYLSIESGPDSAEKYLRIANKMKKYEYHLTHFYLFMFYKDNNYPDGALKEAKWLYRNLREGNFAQQFPIYAQRELHAIRQYFDEIDY